MESRSTKSLNKINLTKSDISTAVYREIGLSKSESSDLVNSLFNHLTDALEKGDTVKLSNFGTFKLSEKKERIGRNPKTGKPVIISKRKVTTFKPSPHFSSRVNAALEQTPPQEYQSKEDLLGLLSNRLRCNVDDVRFLFEKSDQDPVEDEIEIPDGRFHI